MEVAPVIWVDLQLSPATADLSAKVAKVCQLHKVREIERVGQAINALRPCAVFFEYNEPSDELLAPLKRLASDFRESRFVMITQQHSESLAVWALRARVWDYLVKPVDLSYLLSCTEVLLDIEGNFSESEEKNDKFEQGTTLNQDKGVTLNDGLPIGMGQEEERWQKRLTPALTFIRANYSERITLEAVARLCGLGRYQFSRAFKQTHGTTFREFLILHRLQKAEWLLRCTNASITDIAFSVGFNDLSHFAQMFHRYVGVRPSDYAQDRQRGERDMPFRESALRDDANAKLS